MKIPFLDMTREAKELIELGIMENIEEVILSGHYLFGPKAECLENFFSEYFNSNAVLVGSGTDALAISLKAIGICVGDLVAIPAFTAIPTAIAVKMIGALPVYIDIDDTLTMDMFSLEKIINSKTKIKAIIPVHLFGNIANLDFCIKICKDKNIPIIEDCAQSFGSKINNKCTGTIGTAGAFSFYPSKNLGSFGDSGLIITSNYNLAKLAKELRFYGQISKYKMGDGFGFNSRTDEIQSTILIKKTETIEKKLSIRKKMKKQYDDALSVIKEIKLPEWRGDAVPHLYPILVKNREVIMEKLNNIGIETIIHYPFCLPEEIEKSSTNSLKAKEISKKILSIPFNPWMTDEEIKYVLDNVVKIME